MKISQKNKSALYGAIREPIIDLRIKHRRSNSDTITINQFDDDMFQLEQKIWSEIKSALKIED